MTDGGAGSSATTVPKGNATALVDGWATCMRNYGDPDQADPTIGTDIVIHVTIPASAPGVMKGSALKPASPT